MKKSKNRRNNYHLKKYSKIIEPLYENVHNEMNEYILSFKKNDDKFVAEYHCIHNLFVFALCRLKLFSQKTKDDKFTFFDTIVRINKTAEKIGVSNHKLDGTW
tara:strand:+ start:104 stop:412 length:309 start_codon:yes stop_codon:yes gene_type:complete